MRKTNEQSIGEIIKDIFNSPTIKQKLMASKVEQFWAEELGPFINNNTSEVKVYNKTIGAKLKSAALRQELMMQRENLLEKINSYIGEPYFTEIHFT